MGGTSAQANHVHDDCQHEGCEEAGHLHGDLLESVVERVPVADLAAAARVSREWLRAVRSALRRRPRRLPWLVVHLHLHGHRRCRTAAYDPYSGTWFAIPALCHATSTPSQLRLVRCSRGDRVCALSLSSLSIASDAFGTTSACDGVALKAPGVWRVDPVFAAVGDRVVALGGACRLALAEGEDAAAVEVHESGNWIACDPMPGPLRESAAATWLSVAATDRRVYLTDRTTGWTSWFDPVKRRWGPTRHLRPDATISTWAVVPGSTGSACAERLVLFGAKREGVGAENRVVVQTWEVDGDALHLFPAGAAHGAMPSDMSERLFPRDEEEEQISPSIGVCGNCTGGYVYNAAEPASGAVLYELLAGEKGSAVERWDWVPCAPTVRDEPLGLAILACSPVGLDELPSGWPRKGPLACSDSSH